LFGVYKLRNLAIVDYSSDSSSILVFVRKNYVILTEFQHISIDGYITSFNSNHALHAGTLSSTGNCLLTHDAVAALLVLCSRGKNILFVVKKLHR